MHNDLNNVVMAVQNTINQCSPRLMLCLELPNVLLLLFGTLPTSIGSPSYFEDLGVRQAAGIPAFSATDNQNRTKDAAELRPRVVGRRLKTRRLCLLLHVSHPKLLKLVLDRFSWLRLRNLYPATVVSLEFLVLW